MFRFDLRPNPVVVAIGAHCDDIEIGCGATLAALAAARPDARIHCWFFSGDAARQAESRHCLDLLLGPGRADLRCLSFRDGYFPADWGAVKDAYRQLAAGVDADLVFTHQDDDAHQDHRVLAELAGQTFRRQTVLQFEIPKLDGDLGRPGVYMPLQPAQLAAKVDALMKAFPTQAGKAWFTPATFEGLARLRGIECNAPGGLAEAFYTRKVRLGAGAFGSA